MKGFNNKWIRAAIPALLIHCSIGTVYCWSLVKDEIFKYMELEGSKSQIEWAFSFAIFFLGMSAAFAGHIVEKDIKKSSTIAAVCFSAGMALTGLSIYMKSLVGVYLSYGVLMGIGLGIGYLTPVKTLMLWFKEQKGLATGLAVAGFGLAKVIASPIMTALLAVVEVYQMFYILAAVYFVLMMLGHFMIKKPDGWVEDHGKTEFTALAILKSPVFIGIWLMVYINISCGLALISQEKDIMKAIGLSAATIAAISSLTAIFNAGGRLGYSALSDKMKKRDVIYTMMFILSIAATVVALLTNAIAASIVPIVIILLCVVNSTYGGGFSNLPTVLSEHYGMKHVSQIHGFALSAWAMAGLTGNQISALIVAKTGSYNNVLYVTTTLYIIAFIVSALLLRAGKKED